MIIKNGIDWTKVLHEYRIVFIFAILYLIVLTTKGALAANKTIFLVVFYISTLFNMMIFPFFLGNKMFTDSFRQVRRTLVFLSITIALMIISDFLYGQLFEHSIIESISKGKSTEPDYWKIIIRLMLVPGISLITGIIFSLANRFDRKLW